MAVALIPRDLLILYNKVGNLLGWYVAYGLHTARLGLWCGADER